MSIISGVCGKAFSFKGIHQFYGGWSRALKVLNFYIFILTILFISNNFIIAAALDDYIALPDSNYTFALVNSSTKFIPYTTAYTIDLTSQGWRGSSEVNPVNWNHWLTIYKPANFALDSDTALLLISDGNSIDPAPLYEDQFRLLAYGTGSVIAVLTAVPNQPLQFADEIDTRSEDEIIAYSWDKFLRGGDEYWPVQLPMVKSVVRAMDTVQDFLAGLSVGSVTINHFVLTGGSKRGWTAWLAAAADERVTAIAPIVSDLLNMKRSFAHQWGAYGFWAEALSPYEGMGIFDWFDSNEVTDLLGIVDPYEYRDRLTMPKFIITAAGDDFFVSDSSQFYINDLEGEVYLRIVPNTNHYLDGAYDDVLNSMVPYYDAFLHGYPRPVFSWSLEADGSIRVETVDMPKQVKLWHASNETSRDFRQVTIGPSWVSSILSDIGGGVYIGQVSEPDVGWTAFFVELIYDNPFSQQNSTNGEYDYRFTTQMRVLPESLPFEGDLNRDRFTDACDLEILSQFWLSDNTFRDIGPRGMGDGIVNFQDYSVFGSHWLE